MAELVFFTGTMDCGKSTLAAQVNYTHASRGRRGIVFTRNDRAGTLADLEKVYTFFPVLRERRKQLSGTLSGGEVQMLVIGRGLYIASIARDTGSRLLAGALSLTLFVYECGVNIFNTKWVSPMPEIFVLCQW